MPLPSHVLPKKPLGREGGRLVRLREERRGKKRREAERARERVSRRAATGNDTETSPGSNPNLAPDMKEKAGNLVGRGGKRREEKFFPLISQPKNLLTGKKINKNQHCDKFY